MKVSQFTQLALVATLAVGIQACGNKNDKSHVADEAAAAQEKVETDPCPVGVESLWYTMGEDPTAFAVAKVDGVIRVTLGGYQEQIYVNGEPQLLTPKAKGKQDNKVEVTARCEEQVILMTQKTESGSEKLSEWRLNAEEATGSLTIKDGKGKTEQIIPLRMNLVPATGTI